MPFSSARKWSGASFAGRGAFFLGAPRCSWHRRRAAGHPTELLRRAEQIAVEGRRVVLWPASRPLDGERHPAPLEPLAMVVIGDRVRADAADTVAWFAAEGSRSRSSPATIPETVGAVAGQVGIAGADHPVDARPCPRARPSWPTWWRPARSSAGSCPTRSGPW